VAEGRGTAETPFTPTGLAVGDAETLPVLAPSEFGGTESSGLGLGSEVGGVEAAGGGTDPGGDKSVTVGVGENVLLVLVDVGDVDDGNGGEVGGLDPGGRPLEVPPLPLSGVVVHVFSCLTMSTPSTTIGVRVILHVRINVPAPVVILSVFVTVTGDVRLDSCLGNTVDVCGW